MRADDRMKKQNTDGVCDMHGVYVPLRLRRRASRHQAAAGGRRGAMRKVMELLGNLRWRGGQKHHASTRFSPGTPASVRGWVNFQGASVG